MQVGCLGDITFEVSDNTIKTINNFKRTGSARYATHQRVNNVDLPEMTGVALQNITFDIMISSYLGCDPGTEIKKIIRASDSGKVMRMVLGDDYYGRFVIQSWAESAQTYHPKAGVTTETVSLTLLEYTED